MKRLSVCMIVKDEEAVLGRCLDSVSEIADEIIIVDTGSADRTKEIASQYTNLIYDYTWSNDFAAARNESLSHATGKWILVLDADEYLPSNQMKEWNEFLNHEVPENNIAYTLMVVNLADKGSNTVTMGPVTRLLPNFKGIRYTNPIHEQLEGTKEELYQKKITFNIFHTGYQSETFASKNKHQRNMAIFEKMKSSGVMSAYDYFTLGNQHTAGGDFANAIECYEKSLRKNKNKSSIWYPYCVMSLIGIYLNQNQLNLSWALVETRLSEFSKFPDYHTMKGLHLEALGYKEEAYECYQVAITRAEKLATVQSDFWLVNPDFGFEVPVTQLMNLSFQLEHNDKAIYWMTKLLQHNNKDTSTLLRFLEWLSQHETQEAIIEFLNRFYNLSETGDCLFLYRIALATGLSKLVDYYYKFVVTSAKLNDIDQTRLALIHDNHKQWKEHAIHIIENQDLNSWVQIAVGSVLWNENLESNNEHFSEQNAFLKQIINDEMVQDEQRSKHAKELFLIAKNLFVLRRFDHFDQFVTKANNPEVINMLANYFYNLKLHDLSMKYYSVLLNQSALDVLSLENLGMYHANHGYSEETVEFLSALLERKPEKRDVYPTLLKHVKNQDQRNYFVEKYKNEFPEFLSISFVNNSLLNKISSKM